LGKKGVRGFRRGDDGQTIGLIEGNRARAQFDPKRPVASSNSGHFTLRRAGDVVPSPLGPGMGVTKAT
jgi:hypothetical protein